ncbi:hypothetical protein L1887_48046 [Cichorium endivia]|nr:hypothetical protein L1887_48046 [Cichorium endivia]
MCQHDAPRGSSKTHDYPTHASEESRPVRSGLIRSVHERRLDEFVGGQFGDYNLASVLFEARTDEEKQRRASNSGPSWTNHWLKLKLNVPKDWVHKEWLQLEFDPGCEAMIFTEAGMPLQGITGGFEDNRRVDFPLKQEYRNGVTFYIEITANGMFGLPSDGSGDPDPNRYFELQSCDIVVKRAEAWKLLWDFDLLKGCVKNLSKDTELQNRALWVANQVQNTFRKAGPRQHSPMPSRRRAHLVLGPHPHRQRLALALLSHTAEGGTLVVDADRPHGPLPRASLHRVYRPAVPVARDSLPRPLQEGQGLRRGRPASSPLAARGSSVTPICPPRSLCSSVPLRSEVLSYLASESAATSSGCPTPLATTPRSPSSPASPGCDLLLHPEAQLEQHQPLPA